MHQQDRRAVAGTFIDVGEPQGRPIWVLDLGVVRSKRPVQKV